MKFDSKSWYQNLKKPKWSPPSWVFGTVWSILYILIFISFGYIFFKGISKELTFLQTLPFIVNIFSNILFSPIQWGLRSNILATLDIFIVLVSIVWIMVSIYPEYSWIAYIQIPYLIWVCIATVLQISITVMNLKD